MPQFHQCAQQLQAWCKRQRRLYRRGSLAEDRRAQLEEAGFDLNVPQTSREEHWNSRYQQLKTFYLEHKHCHVRGKPVHPSVIHWIEEQRKNYRDSKLSDERLQLLKEIAFPFDASLRRMRILPVSDPNSKGIITDSTKANHPIERPKDVEDLEVTALSEHDVVFNRPGEKKYSCKGNAHFDELLSDIQPIYIATSRSKATAKTLILIVQNRGGRFFRQEPDGTFHKLTNEDALEKAKSALDRNEIKEASSCSPSLEPCAGNIAESREVATRSARGGVRDSAGPSATSDSKGMAPTVRPCTDWSCLEEVQRKREARSWDERYQELLLFRASQGKDPDGSVPQLQSWCKSQQRLYRKGSLAEDRRTTLEEAGFDVTVLGPRKAAKQKTLREENWDAKYQQLKKFHSEHNHCHVSNRSYPSLVKWMYKQRGQCRASKLSNERQQLLKEIDFPFDAPKTLSEVNDARWEASYQKLANFYKQHGHSSVYRIHKMPRQASSYIY